MRRKQDKFMQDMGRIHRARQRRRAQRQNQHLLDEETSLCQVGWENFQDGLEFRTQEFSALGKEVGRGVTRETAGIAKDFLKVGTGLTIDLLAGIATLGLTEQPSSITSRHRKRRRRR